MANRSPLWVLYNVLQKSFFDEKGHRMLLAQIFWGQLTENSTNNMAQYIRFNLHMIFLIKMIWYWGLNKRLYQFGKSFSSFENKK